MPEPDLQTQSQSHRDENNAPRQEDRKKPKPFDQEQPAETPEVSKRTPDAQYPADGEGPRVGPRKKVAGGVQSVLQSTKFALRESPTRSIRSLLVANQKGGFDCPSCAWPEPDGDRHAAEFCEN